MIQKIALTRKAYRSYMEPVMQKYSLSMAELTILLILDRTGGNLLAIEICNMFGMAKSHVSAAVTSLCEKQFIRRTQDVHDHKKFRLSLHENAAAAVEEIRRRTDDYGELCTRGFSEHEKRMLHEMMERICMNIEEAL